MFCLVHLCRAAAVLALCLILVACNGGADSAIDAQATSGSPLIASLADPGFNGVVKVSPVTIKGTLNDQDATVTVGGVTAAVSGGTFSAAVPLAEGSNRIDVVASADGKSESRALEVTLNTTEMCGTGELIEISLPGVTFPNDPKVGDLPGSRLPNDTVSLPNGCSIYAFFVHGYGRNEKLDELMFYKLAKVVAENNGYVHWSWWNNFLAEYMARPLHSHPDAKPSPGNLLSDFLAFTLPEGRGKGVPDDDFQFQSDALRVLQAVRAANPDAIIIVAGHSMGGNATARLGFNTTVDIDLLAPIDPVGNRNLPDGVGGAIAYQTGLRTATPGTDRYTPGNETYNWTRWRATREFRGYKQRDCIRNGIGLCRDFDPRLFFTEYRCRLVPENDWLEHPPLLLSLAPIRCPRRISEGPVRDAGIPIRFSTHIKRLYHRWQQEYYFPYDYHADDPGHEPPIRGNYIFGAAAARSTSILGANYQAPVPENPLLGSDPDKTCANPGAMDPRGAISFGGTPLNCEEWDGHGEIIGMRALTGLEVAPTNNNLQPLALKARPFDTFGDLWIGDTWFDVDQSAERKAALVAMATAVDPDTGADTWPHRPVNPDLDLVVDDMVLILNDIMLRGTPGEDVTPPSSSATPDVEPNEHGWNNTDVVVTILAIDEQGGSGVKQIQFSYSGAEDGNGVVEGDSVEILFTAEGETTLEYFATDNAGNVEETQTLTVRIDKTPPVITAATEPAPNENGWNNTDVTVTFEASDELSGIDTVTEPITVTEEGADQEVVGEAIDRAGNSATVGVIVNIDKTPPVIVGLPADCSLWPPNHKLVEVADVIATDELSGIDEFNVDAASSEPETGPGYGPHAPDVVITDGTVELRAERYSPEGRTYDLAATATDRAGNIATGDAVCIVPHDQGN